MQKKKNKFKDPEKYFFEQKWFKILCVIGFYIFLYYPFNGTFQIEKKELISLNATVKENSKSGGRRNPIKIHFQTNEYSNRFGIYAGGAYGRYTEINQSLIKNTKITIKIHRDNLKKLKIESEIIYLTKFNKSCKVKFLYSQQIVFKIFFISKLNIWQYWTLSIRRILRFCY